jgi:GNAT superfamily N-acetyltransferase
MDSWSTDMTEIRRATIDDLDDLVCSCAALFAEDGAARDRFRNVNWPAVHGATWCADVLADPVNLVIVATAEGEVVGHLIGMYSEPSEMWTASRAELVSMFVAEPVRGQGVGGLLVEEFITWARERGATRMHVQAYATNEAAIRLYQRHGFTPLSTTLVADL